LLWYQTFDSDLSGKPEMLDGKLISAGRSTGGSRQIVAMNPDDGAVLWRQPSERFVDVSTDPSTKRAWYVSGDAGDPAAVALYSLAVESGERKQLARWKRPAAVNLGAVAYARDRVFVLTVSTDVGRSTMTIAIDCVTSTGEKIWNREHQFTANLLQMHAPLELFRVQGDLLVYSIGQDVWSLNATDGMEREHHEDPVSAGGLKRNDYPWTLWPVSSFLIEGGRVYAFTSDRAAYSRQLRQ
jgi:outer membrane protein assembly factor BamB